MWAERGVGTGSGGGSLHLKGWQPSMGSLLNREYMSTVIPGKGVLVETQAFCSRIFQVFFTHPRIQVASYSHGHTEHTGVHSFGLDILVSVPTGFRADSGTLETPRRSSPLPWFPQGRL